MINIPTPQEAMVIAMQHRLKQSQCMPTDQRNQLQQRSVEALLQHALNTVPYYQKYPGIAAILQGLPIKTETRILDIPAGGGYLASYLPT
jgi:phenylacetate-CoA ligase